MKKREITVLIIGIVFGVVAFFYDSIIANWIVSLRNTSLDMFFSIFRPSIVFGLLAVIAFVLISIRGIKKRYDLSLILSAIVAIVISFAIKFIVARSRPFGLEKTLPLIGLNDYSFPSTNSAMAFSILPSINKELGKEKYFWWVLAVLMVGSRLYFGIHYLSDIIFGSLLGYLIGIWMIKLETKYKLKQKLLRRIKV